MNIFDFFNYIHYSKYPPPPPEHVYCGDCTIHYIIKNLPENLRDAILVQLFWSAWIDQVLYFVLVETSTTPEENELYESFRVRFPLPKLGMHAAARFMCPEHFIYFPNNYDYRNNKDLFIRYKDMFWGPVEKWLIKIGRIDVWQKAICAFIEDFGTRVPKKLHYLFNLRKSLAGMKKNPEYRRQFLGQMMREHHETFVRFAQS